VILDEFIVTLLEKADAAEEEVKDAVGAMTTLQDVEKVHILKVLQHTGWHFGKTCGILGISRPTLRQKLKEYDIALPS
jgi:two-component system response regulator AtoC